MAELRGVNIADALTDMGYDKTYLKNRDYLHSDNRARNVTTVMRIAQYFGVDPGWLMGFGTGVHQQLPDRMVFSLHVAAHIYVAMCKRDAPVPHHANIEEAIELFLQSIGR